MRPSTLQAAAWCLATSWAEHGGAWEGGGGHPLLIIIIGRGHSGHSLHSLGISYLTGWVTRGLRCAQGVLSYMWGHLSGSGRLLLRWFGRGRPADGVVPTRCHESWRRPPLAPVMYSDAHELCPLTSSPGHRHRAAAATPPPGRLLPSAPNVGRGPQSTTSPAACAPRCCRAWPS